MKTEINKIIDSADYLMVTHKAALKAEINKAFKSQETAKADPHPNDLDPFNVAAKRKIEGLINFMEIMKDPDSFPRTEVNKDIDRAIRAQEESYEYFDRAFKKRMDQLPVQTCDIDAQITD